MGLSSARSGSGCILLSYAITLLPTIFMLAWLSACLPKSSQGFGTDFGDSLANYDQVFNWHPLLMTLAFATLFSQAALHFRLLPYSHEVNKVFHMATNTLALIVSSTGLAVILKCKTFYPNYEFYSIHSWLGIGAFSGFCAQYVLGFTSFFFPKFSESTRRAFLPYHKYVGLCLYFMTLLTLATGVMDRMSGVTPGGQISPPDPATYPDRNGSIFVVVNLYAFSLLLIVCTVAYHHFTPKERSLTVQVRDEDDETNYGRLGENQ